MCSEALLGTVSLWVMASSEPGSQMAVVYAAARQQATVWKIGGGRHRGVRIIVEGSTEKKDTNAKESKLAFLLCFF